MNSKNSINPMTGNLEGTTTGRISAKTPAQSNTPKSAKPVKAAKAVTTPKGPKLCETENYFFVGGHQGERTKFSHPYNYDPILVFYTGLTPTGSLYSDRLSGWYERSVLDALMTKHFGNAGDYYHTRKPTAIEAFLRELMDKPTLVLTRVEEQCNQATGYPLWFFEYKVDPV